jgi:acyl-CoA hydrolase
VSAGLGPAAGGVFERSWAAVKAGLSTLRKIVEAGALDVLPCHLSQFAAILRDGDLKIDIVLLQSFVDTAILASIAA